MEVVEEQLAIILANRFQEFKLAVYEDMKQLLALHERGLENKFNSEKQRLEQVIAEQSEQLQETQGQSSTQTIIIEKTESHLDNYIAITNAKKTLTNTFEGWRNYIQGRKKRRRMNNYVINFYKRGRMRGVFKAWKIEAHMIFKDHEQEMKRKITQQSRQDAKNEFQSEVSMLKKMVVELTEDLRAETIAKNSLRYQFEQALLRGMNALSMESMSIEQGAIERSKDMSEVSKTLLYTPERYPILK